nr:MAG TPA: hypothetical protein [Caudoviricetes sp.]
MPSNLSSRKPPPQDHYTPAQNLNQEKSYVKDHP